MSGINRMSRADATLQALSTVFAGPSQAYGIPRRRFSSSLARCCSEGEEKKDQSSVSVHSRSTNEQGPDAGLAHILCRFRSYDLRRKSIISGVSSRSTPAAAGPRGARRLAEDLDLTVSWAPESSISPPVLSGTYCSGAVCSSTCAVFVDAANTTAQCS